MKKGDKTHGLSSAEEVLQAADAITNLADKAQKWVFERFGARQLDQEKAHELFASINQIRHISNILYTAAATVVVKNLGESQQEIIHIIDEGKAAIEKIDKARKMIDLIADILALAAAINTGKPASVLASLREVRKDTEVILAI
ncbi:MAG: hypothetical protein WCG31_08150 [Deltaproteobacteria bacterium]